MQRLVSAILRAGGFRVDCVLTGREAIAAIAKVEYDALLLDLMMPHEGGTTVMSHLRKNKPELLSRAIVLTASSKRVVSAVAKDAAAVVRKPFETSDLLDVVERVSAS